MLKYSTGRGKPGWGREELRPIWWPVDVPWANVRSDVRTDEWKQKVLYFSSCSMLMCIFAFLAGSTESVHPGNVEILNWPQQAGLGKARVSARLVAR